ncbi:peptidyl-prolyl cis-trans isomerase [Candidatus Sumerlaeota bacterium]|nr:peptidyl-prolyl cis-trans isomerase [Candidatus Sumerlaeota bacterium]
MKAILAAALLALALACGGGEVTVPAPVVGGAQTIPRPPEPVPPPPPVVNSSNVAFEIDGQEYTEQYVAEQRQAYLSACAAAGITPVDEATHCEMLIDEILLQHAAERSGLLDDPAIAAQIEAQRRRLIGELFVQRVIYAGLGVTDAEVEAHYRANLERYLEPEQIRIRELRFDTREEAEAAHRRLMAGGVDFDALARELNIVPIDPGWFTRDQVPPELASVAFPLAIGQVGPIVSIDSGHLIIMKVVSIPQRLQPLSEVADEIRAELLAERRRRVLRMFLTSERRSQGFGGDPVSVP